MSTVKFKVLEKTSEWALSERSSKFTTYFKMSFQLQVLRKLGRFKILRFPLRFGPEARQIPQGPGREPEALQKVDFRLLTSN